MNNDEARVYIESCDDCGSLFERDAARQPGQFVQCRECWENETPQPLDGLA